MRFDVLYIDCPWAYENKKTGGSMKSGSEAKYPTMTLAQLKELPVKDIASRNCILFLWATVPMLPEAFELMKHWGFKYKTMLTWDKTGRKGMGFWYRGKTEHLLLGIKGKVKAFRLVDDNLVSHPVLTHSEKPEAFRELIEKGTNRVMVNPLKLELFARRQTGGWTCLGNFLNGIDIYEELFDLILLEGNSDD